MAEVIIDTTESEIRIIEKALWEYKHKHFLNPMEQVQAEKLCDDFSLMVSEGYSGKSARSVPKRANNIPNI